MNLSVAATLLVLTWLLAEQALLSNTALRRGVGSLRGLARFLVGALLVGAALGAAQMLLFAAIPVPITAAVSAAVAISAGFLLLRYRQREAVLVAIRWPALILVLLFVALTSVAQDAREWLVGAGGLALGLALGVPAYGALVDRFNDSEVPAAMRPLPTRILASGVIALALAGCLSCW